jgi:hypothetical protein
LTAAIVALCAASAPSAKTRGRTMGYKRMLDFS